MYVVGGKRAGLMMITIDLVRGALMDNASEGADAWRGGVRGGLRQEDYSRVFRRWRLMLIGLPRSIPPLLTYFLSN